MQIRNVRFLLLLVLLVGGAVVIGIVATRPDVGLEDSPFRTEDEEEARAETPDLPVGPPGLVVGEVKVFKTGEPAAGIVVEISGGADLVGATTDEKGRFEAEVGSGIELTVTVKAPEPFASVVLKGVTVKPDQTEDLGTLYLERGLMVYGIVVDRGGEPVEGAAVSAFRPEFESAGRNFIALFQTLAKPKTPLEATVSAGDGKFTFRKLAPGTYRFQAEKEGLAAGFVQNAIVSPEAESHVWRIVLAPGVSLAGSVRTSKGDPIAEATVTALRDSRSFQKMEFQPVRTTTDDDGKFAFASLAPGRTNLMVDAEGFPQSFVNNVAVGQVEKVDVVVGGTSAIEGRITDPEGEPVEGADITLAVFRGNGLMARITSDADGRFLIENLPAGQIQIFSVNAAGFAQYPSGMSMFQRGGAGSLEEGKTLTKNVKLVRGAAVVGRISDGSTGRAVAGAEVSLGTGPFGGAFGGGSTTRSDADGNYRLEGVGEGTHMLTIRAAGFYQKPLDPQTMRSVRGWGGQPLDNIPADVPVVRVEAGTDQVTKDLEVLPGGTLSGTVVDPAGAPVGGARVTLSGRGGMWGGMELGPQKTVLTDSEGGFRLEGVRAADQLRVQAEAQGWIDGTSDPIALGSGQETGGVIVRLRAGGSVAGRVMGADGAPLARASVRAAADPGAQNAWQLQWAFRQSESVLTDEAGEFRIEGLTPGATAVEVEAPGHQRTIQQGITVPDGSETGGLVVKLARGLVISGRVTTEAGSGLAGVQVSHSLESPDNRNRGFGRGGDRVTSGDDGAFEIGGLAEGTYRLSFSRDGYASQRKNGVPGDTTGVEMVLPKGRTISGRVRLPSGGPATGVWVSAGSEDGNRGNTRTGEDGTFSLDGLSPAVYDLSVNPGGGFGGSSDGESLRRTTVSGIVAPSEGVEIRLLAGSEIRGVVVDEAGKPISNAMVTATGMDLAGGNPERGWARVDENGAFRISGIGEGEFQLQAMRAGYTAPTITVSAGASNVKIVMKVDPNAGSNAGPGGMSLPVPVRPR